MLLCKVHNLITDQRYEFRAQTQAEIDEKLARKVAVYGRPAWTETIPAWTDTLTDPPTEHPEQTTEHPAERTVEVTDTAADDAAAQAQRDLEQEARDYFAALDFSKIPDAETRRAIRHLWRLVKRIA